MVTVLAVWVPCVCRAAEVPGEDDLVLTQVHDYLARAGSACYIGSGPCAAPGPRCGSGEQQMQGRQVRQELVLADVGVLRAGRVRCHGAGVAVPAPVGGLAIGPG